MLQSLTPLTTPELSNLVDRKAELYGRQSVTVAEAWQAYDQAVDDGLPYAVVNKLFQDAQQLEQDWKQAGRKFDLAKSLILQREAQKYPPELLIPTRAAYLAKVQALT